MRPAAALFALALTACSGEPPSGPSPSPGATPAPPATRALPFDGAYVLSVSIAAECARAFPVGVRVRRWDVRVLDVAERSELDFEDPVVADSVDGPGYSSEAVLVAAGSARLTLHFGELLGYSRGAYGDPHVYWVEGVSASARGDAVPVVAASLEGQLAGRITYDAGSGARAQCTSERHDFHLRPR